MGFLELIQNWGPRLLEGAMVTLQLVILSGAAGLVLAVPIALALVAANPLLRWPAYGYSLFFRGTPLLVQIFLLYFGLGQFAWMRDSLLWPLLREPYACALIAFSLNTAAYTGELLRGGIRAVPRGEVEAARSCGMSTWMTYRLIVLPRAFRIILPAYSNELILLLKASSLASTITLLDLMGVARLAVAKTYAPIQLFIIAGAIYYVMTLVISYGLRRLEGRINRYLQLAR
ncbi:MAG: ABC transporter permease [Alphaproteobacteria bacterium]|jgi:His/Glu/Gln/Arg/opine family amino acid ABC transporter permease subunit|nr:ABC transporter permease [Alphaproteobacteria bacterium]